MRLTTDTTADTAERAASIHREILQLSVLAVLAIATFLVTRGLAANNRAVNLRDADEWYRRGQEAVAAGRLDDATEAFRRAAVRNRVDKTYVLALARALALNHDADAARSVVLTLRDSAPEDTDINLELARLAALRNDVTEALRFYHNALYAPWPAEHADARRAVRFELIQFLLTHHQSARAVAELLAMSTDLPEQPDVHMQVAQLLSQAGDYDHALQQFQQVLRLAPDRGLAYAGAGMSAFHLGQFQLARNFLRRAPSDLPDVSVTRDVADLVLARDPLANRIGSSERRHRLMSNFESAQSRVQLCADHALPSTDMTDVLQEAAEFQEQLASSAILEQDTIEAGVELVYRLEQQAEKACGPATPLDRALLLIGREHSEAR